MSFQLRDLLSFCRPLGCAFWLVLLSSSGALALPAFPGAEGFGANAVGGRGGTVFHVTTTNDNGPSSLAGSLRQGVSVANRTIVFDVSGTINLTTDLKISKNNITIAGQTAPGDGICLKGWLTSVQDTHDVIVRYIRCRPGDVACPTFQDDSFHFVNATNCIVDHVTATWSIDECLSCTWSTNITAQWCIIGQSLKNSCHVKGAHGYGSLLRYANGGVTYHHNLYVDNDSRNPRPGDDIHLDFVNNVVYNWGGTAGYNADDSADDLANGGLYFTNVLNYVSNYFIAGPSTSGHLTVAFDAGVTNSLQCQIYQSGNLIDSDKNGSLNGANTGWSMFGSPYTQLVSRFGAPQVSTDTPGVACERVLAFVGASAARDAVDTQIITDVRNQTGAIIDSETQVGGWPTLNSSTAPMDTDQDGIPDYWELALGWSTSVTNNNHVNTDGYTDLEWYLNWLAAPHALCNRNGSVDVNLRKVLGVTNAFGFGVTSASNGVVSLLGDGFTARFIATNNFNGLAGFNFNATNPATGIGFGPIAVNVLITTTNAPNTTPILTAIPDTNIPAGTTLNFTNTASDSDIPAQTLTYSLLNPPSGASVNSSNGVFNWRPAIVQSGSSNFMKMVVTDNGSPNLSATQAFSVLVTAPASPQVQSSAYSGGSFSFTVGGDIGPDYIVQGSTNLTAWNNLFTNTPSALPFLWTDSGASSFSRRFYRIQLGP
jgi:pectate lyase